MDLAVSQSVGGGSRAVGLSCARFGLSPDQRPYQVGGHWCHGAKEMSWHSWEFAFKKERNSTSARPDRKCLRTAAKCSAEHLGPTRRHVPARLTSQLLRVAPRAGLRGLWPVSGVPGSHACRSRYSTQPAGPSRVAVLPGKGVQLELEEMLVPRKMSISPLESWLTAHYLLPRLDAGVPGTVSPAQAYECPPGQVGGGAEQGREEVQDAPQIQCKNVLKIRRRKMNHHKYRKLVKRTRFLRRRVREGRLKRKQVRFEKDLKRIWLKAGLKEAPPGWQTPKIYLRGK
ncbi:aurora kinase A-interacting protein [Myotis lucifugus]|nr:aurora kinase A-interacting protein [Myotis lucifugus]